MLEEVHDVDGADAAVVVIVVKLERIFKIRMPFLMWSFINGLLLLGLIWAMELAHLVDDLIEPGELDPV